MIHGNIVIPFEFPVFEVGEIVCHQFDVDDTIDIIYIFQIRAGDIHTLLYSVHSFGTDSLLQCTQIITPCFRSSNSSMSQWVSTTVCPSG